MKKSFKWTVLSGIFLLYSFLYIATTKRPPCDEICQKFDRVSERILKDSAVVFLGQYGTSAFSITVTEHPLRNWKGLADSACIFMNNEGLRNYTVNIIGYSQRDTLLKQTCP